ncbi:hypothetical protein ACTQ5J_05140 [Fundicoccus sp. Sow4_F4]|uniref:hypothetical protein n=1 Tax=Fundicoccus sp. Sow4_F4 TaxID=3438783 RepID=UPI003F8E66CE
MWMDLEPENKLKYKALITNFASLSEAFSQKSEDLESESILNSSIAPIVNSKFQETVFQKSFGAMAEDIANTSYDVSLVLNEYQKYLVGIKSFGFNSGDQKIAQFKSSSTSENWEETLSQIKRNADSVDTKEDADGINEPLYLELARRISTLRNTRIASSTEQIRGFEVDDTKVEAIYHVLMPSGRNEAPKIFVGEIAYLPIEIDNIEIIGSTNKRTPTNFKFSDGQHQYKYTSADSQLYMSFRNKEIILDTWDVEYVKDPFYLFENLHLLSDTEHVKGPIISKTVSWMIANQDGEIEKSSGFNGFAGASKLARKNQYREKRIAKIKEIYGELISSNAMRKTVNALENILLPIRSTDDEREEAKTLREELVAYIKELNNPSLLKEVETMVFRPESEMYIPIPNSKEFHLNNPDFFGKNIGSFEEGNKLSLPKEERSFKMKFLASGEIIESYINQDNGKAIQSIERQDILGEWILRGVFQLEPREPLTAKRLEEIGINAIRLSKYEPPIEEIGIEFIWIDTDTPPEDAIGWVANQS